MFYRVKNTLHGIFHRKNETGGKLLQFPTGVHERRRVRHEGKGSHEVEVEFRGLLDLLGVGPELSLGQSNVIGHPAEKVLRPLKWIPLVVPFKVSFGQDNTSVFRELRRRQGRSKIEGFLLFRGLAVSIPRLTYGHVILRKLVVFKQEKEG